MAVVSVSKAARMAGKGRSTIQRHIKDGKLSAGKDASGNPVIDVSELIFVYGEIKADDTDKIESTKQPNTGGIDQTALTMLEALREELRAAREREDWLKGQLEQEQQRSRELEIRMLPPSEPEKKGFFARLLSK